MTSLPQGAEHAAFVAGGCNMQRAYHSVCEMSITGIRTSELCWQNMLYWAGAAKDKRF